MRECEKNIIIICFIISSFCIACQSNTTNSKEHDLETRVENLETFTRLYGYARWFHPSDEAKEIDWDKFAILGVRKVENIKSTAALRDTLYRLFSPIVQGLQIYDARKPEIFNSKILLSPDLNAKSVAWQHLGVYLNEDSNIYSSLRTNKIESGIQDESALVNKRILGRSNLNGKKVKFSGFFRCEKGDVRLSIKYSENGRDYINHELPIESMEWKKYELTLTIPAKTIDIIYGFETKGQTKVWADDFEFIVNGNEKWDCIETSNMGFESGKTDNIMEPIVDWRTFTVHHKAEVTDENPHSGNYCLKIDYTGKMFDNIPQFGETTKEFIGNNLICVVPLVLQTNGSATYPQADVASLKRLKSDLSSIKINSIFSPQTNLASVVITWNVLQHFFPYFDVIDTDWNKVLGETLKNALTNKRQKDFFVTLSKMIAKINDGHGAVYSEYMHCLPLRLEFVENRIVVTASKDTTLRRGDIIQKIDGKSVMEVLNEDEEIASGSSQLRRYRALNILGAKLDADPVVNPVANKEGDESPFNSFGNEFTPSSGTSLVFERDGKEQNGSVINSRIGNMYFNPIDDRKYLSETIVEIEPAIYYVNMSMCTNGIFEQKKVMLANAKAVIYDLRGVRKLHLFKILPHLIDQKVYSTYWNIPQTVYPDRKGVEFTNFNRSFQPKQPFFKSKSVIITTSDVISAEETVMDVIDHYKLATTVGKTTAGCNGNTNTIHLQCGYKVRWTGMKVLKHDGKQLYLKGFEPNYPVNETIQAIKEGRDEYLEKALEIARQ